MSDIKKYLLLGFVAQLKAQVATSKAFSSDFYDIFVDHPDAVFEALKQNPFLVSSSCYYIGNYFGFESKNIEKKTIFIDTYKKKILKNLRTGGGDRCVVRGANFSTQTPSVLNPDSTIDHFTSSNLKQCHPFLQSATYECTSSPAFSTQALAYEGEEQTGPPKGTPTSSPEILRACATSTTCVVIPIFFTKPR